ncbi:hypothetical protein SAMN05192553_102697 [Cyclobacterium xiamenense]|uniref:Uncharacterized protein n=1 Tax=Cyclobacterium xiamenense TaxID=1297121 RepID=A0A1H6WGN2_9BACT|nr:hypothetical protein [Cyclobacterium xiamenense]SEJ16199.1 hypothetical protein SAMN05192553_102697 [Cyclobacterium xiamenense]
MSKLTFKEINKDRSKGEYALACRVILKEAIKFADDIDGFIRYWQNTVDYYPQRNHRRLGDSYRIEKDEKNQTALICKTSDTKKPVDLYYIYALAPNESTIAVGL